MDGCFELPEQGITNRWEFGPTGVAGATDFTAWTIPEHIRTLRIWCLGSGAGAGGGCGDIAGNTRAGGGGGGSSGFTILTIGREFLPDVIFLHVGFGGLGTAGSTGGATAGTGAVGRLSRVAAFPNTTADNIICISGAVAATGGNGGGGGGGGAAGNGGTIATYDNMPLGRFGSAQFFAGVGGQAGGAAGADVGNVTPSVTLPFILGGGGGASIIATPRAGGGFNAIANTPFLGSSGGAAGANPGNPGWQFNGMLYVYGGTGAGSSNVAAGAAGGTCGPNACGAGGGGGGGGLTTGGKGGDGGPGRIIITGW